MTNPELHALYDEDRRDAQTYPGDEALIASQGRLPLVQAMLTEGAVHDADDYYHAAGLFQHGERLEHWAQAHLLARLAADLGHPRGRYQAAAALDRWLMRQGRPQKYGTNSVIDGDGWRIWDTDPRTTDAERSEWGVPPLNELIRRADQAFAGLRRSTMFAQPFLKVELQGIKIGLYETGKPPSEADGLDFGVPLDEPLTPGEPFPANLPTDLTPSRYGHLYCARNRRGDVICSWHRCRWQVLEPADADPDIIYAGMFARPQLMSAEDAVWSRVGVATGPEHCWLVGGIQRRSELGRLALAL